MTRVTSASIEAGHNVRTSDGVVHAPGGAPQRYRTMLFCEGRVSAQGIADAGDALVTCLWCVTEKPDTTLRWFKWANEP